MIHTELDNPHAHPPKANYKEQVDVLLSVISKNIDFCSVTNWGSRVMNCLTPEDLEGISNYYNGKFHVENLGHHTYAIRKKDSLTIDLILYCSQEIRTKEGPHITAECCDKPIEEGQELERTIEQIHKLGGKAILEHPFTRDDPVRQYRYVGDGKYRNTVIKAMSLVDGIEVFNSMNTWWQFLANLFAKDSAKKAIYRNGTNIPLLAGGDEHYNIEDIGRVGNLLPEEDLSQATGKEIQQWRWKQYENGNFKRKEQLTTLYTFFKYMMLPTVKRLLFKKERDFKDVCGKVI